jgi:NADH:ubiquinone oxidoreductase subunit K
VNNKLRAFSKDSKVMLIFCIGVFGVAFNKKNVLLLMASVEIMFLGINLVFISLYFFEFRGMP